jgi:primosomal protein N'
VLSQYQQVEILGPSNALISKVQNQFVKQFLVKIKGNSQSVRMQLVQMAAQLKKQNSSAQIIIDVDPM